MLVTEQLCTELQHCVSGVNCLQVQYAYGQESYQRLKKAGSSIDFKTYQGLGHGVDPQEVQDITQFIAKHLPST